MKKKRSKAVQLAADAVQAAGRAADVCIKPESNRWGIFGVILVVVVIASTLWMQHAAGLHRDDLGLAWLAHPTSAKARLGSVLGETLVKERLAVELTESDTLSLINLKPIDSTKPVDVWSIANDLAALVSSAPAQSRLA